MNRIVRRWKDLMAGERLLAGFAVVGILSTLLFAAIALTNRPADISNPDVAFEAAESASRDDGQKDGGERRRISWPRFGFDRERTKFYPDPKLRPPFAKVWKYQQQELIEFAPIIGGDRMYFIDNDGRYVALNVETGRVVWKKRLGKLNASSPTLVDGVLYSVSLEPGQALAVRARDGKVLWRKDLPGRAESSPLVLRGRMYFGTEPGNFYALRAKDGKTIWEKKLAGAVKAAPAFTNNTLYVGDYAGQMYALRSSDGKTVWQQSDLGVGLGRSGRFYSTAAVAFGRVYVGNVDGRVYSFDQKTGEIAWTFSAGDFVYSGIAAGKTPGTRPAVYFGSHDKQVYAVDAETGKEIWSENPGGQVSGPVTVIGNVAYASTFSGNSTVGLNIRSGRRVFKFDEGEYGPAVTDGERVFVVGGSSILALEPVDAPNYKPKKNTKGIVPPAELRRIRRKRRGGGEGTDAPREGAKPEQEAAKGGRAGRPQAKGNSAGKSKGGGEPQRGRKRARDVAKNN